MTEGDWLLLGSSGQLGKEFFELQPFERIRLRPVPRSELDLARPDNAARTISASGARLVINAAAWTDVDGAESHEDQARRVNADGVASVAEACRVSGVPLLHVSTDYVFGGVRNDRRPWSESDATHPRCAYARTKAAGEEAVQRILPSTGVVVRTAWLYSSHSRNFVRTILARACKGEAVEVVNDQWGQPTWARDVAERIIALGERLINGQAPAGIYHATNAGETTWWELARSVYALAGVDPDLVRPQSSVALDKPAVRPTWSVLGHGRWAQAGLTPLRPWVEALEEAFPMIVESSRC